MNRPIIVNIQMVPAGVELVLKALNKMPREESDALFNEIRGQYLYQLQMLNNPNVPEAVEKKDAADEASGD
jgi:hypothetical protein